MAVASGHGACAVNPFDRRHALRKSGSGEVLVVCAANVCRSPFIASLLAAEVPDLVVGSAGTHAMVDAEASSAVLQELARRGVPSTGSGRQLTPAMIRRADIILTATRPQRGHVVQMVGSAAGRTFAAKELMRILESAPPLERSTRRETLQAICAFASASSEQETHDFDDDIADPYGADASAYATMFAEAEHVVLTLARALDTPAG